MIIPNPQDATSLYRGYGPFSELARDYEHIELINVLGQTSIDWAILRQAHILFVQRGFNDQHLAIVEIAKANRLAVWADYDDDLFSVPHDNPVSDIYNNPRVKKNVANIIANSDFVSVSTHQLKRKVEQLNSNVAVIPNALNLNVFQRPDSFDPGDRNRVVLWRGSNTHTRDIMTYASEIMSLYDKHKSGNTAWKWAWIGHDPWFVTQGMEEGGYIYQPPVDTFTMFKVGHAMKPALMHVPLHPNVFNFAKSNIALLESAFWGTVCVCPDWEEWRLPGALNYKDFKEYFSLMDAAMNGELSPEHIKLSKLTWEAVQEKFVLSKMNKQRLKAAESLRETGARGEFKIGDIKI